MQCAIEIQILLNENNYRGARILCELALPVLPLLATGWQYRQTKGLNQKARPLFSSGCVNTIN